MSPNKRLDDAIRQAGWSPGELAAKLGVDPKTVERWISTGRIPHPRLRGQTSSFLDVPAALLWPDAGGSMDGMGELAGIYRTRTELSPATVRSMLVAAERQIDVLAYSALWLWDSVPGFAATVAGKAAAGVSVRLCLGDPDSPAVRVRGEEEGIGETMAARCRLAATYAEPIAAVDPALVRYSGATLYASILRFDDDVLLNVHLWGNAAAESPVMYFNRRDEDGLAANAIKSFEKVWADAQPSSTG